MRIAIKHWAEGNRHQTSTPRPRRQGLYGGAENSRWEKSKQRARGVAQLCRPALRTQYSYLFMNCSCAFHPSLEGPIRMCPSGRFRQSDRGLQRSRTILWGPPNALREERPIRSRSQYRWGSFSRGPFRSHGAIYGRLPRGTTENPIPPFPPPPPNFSRSRGTVT